MFKSLCSLFWGEPVKNRVSPTLFAFLNEEEDERVRRVANDILEFLQSEPPTPRRVFELPINAEDAAMFKEASRVNVQMFVVKSKNLEV